MKGLAKFMTKDKVLSASVMGGMVTYNISSHSQGGVAENKEVKKLSQEKQKQKILLHSFIHKKAYKSQKYRNEN